VAITDAYGREVDVVALQARDAILAHGYFVATDRQHRTRLEVARNGEVWLDTNEALAADTLYVRVDVLGWNAMTSETVDEEGEIVDSVTVAQVTLSLTAASAHGLLVDELEVTHNAELAGNANDDDVSALLEAASRGALTEALQEILPVRRTDKLPLDDRDDALEPILDAKLEPQQMVARLDAFIEAHPSHAGAIYNRAAHKDAMGDYVGALNDYDAALALDDSKDMYADSRSGCLERRAAAHALGRGKGVRRHLQRTRIVG
jgi:tetratricopeptide (TPR) repeat protein